MFEIELIICITMDLALKNLQRLICYKTQTIHQPTFCDLLGIFLINLFVCLDKNNLKYNDSFFFFSSSCKVHRLTMILMVYDQMRFIFQYSPSCGPHSSLIVFLQCLNPISQNIVNSRYDMTYKHFSLPS